MSENQHPTGLDAEKALSSMNPLSHKDDGSDETRRNSVQDTVGKDTFSPKDQHDSSDAIPTTAATTGEEPKRTIVGFRWFLICVAIFSANLLYGLDTTIAGDIQGAVSETYDNISQLGLLGVGFGLGSTVAILPLGKAYAVFDTKWVYIACLTMFAAGSALCGAAPSMAALIVGRVWAGAGGAGMYLGTLNLVVTTTTPKEQSFYVGFEGLVYGGGCILGPIVGGLFADSAATWRWAFYLNLIIFAVTSPIYLFALPSFPQQTHLTITQKIKRFDWLGILLNSALYVCFVLAFSFGGIEWSWSDGRFIALIVLFVVFTLAFVVTQHWTVLTTKKDRLFPCEFLANSQLVLLYICMACGGAALFVAVYYIPLFYLFVRGDSGIEAAVRLLPFVCFYIVAIMVCGYSLPRVGHAWAWFLASGVFLVCGAAAMYTIDIDVPNSHIYGFSVLLGLGLTSSQAAYPVATPLVPPDRVAEVVQFINISQGSSQMIALVIASAIFQSQAFKGMQQVLKGMNFSETQIRAAIAGPTSQVFDKISPELRRECLEVIVNTIKHEWILLITSGALLTICSLFLTKKKF